MNTLNRRDFLTVSTTAGLAAMAGVETHAAEAGDSSRDIYELRQYIIETEEQKAGFERFSREAAIPALHRFGIKPVGVFYPREEGISPIYVLLRHPSMESVTTLTRRFAEDPEFLENGADFINAPADKPAYQRMESSLMIAFTGMPHLDTPVSSSTRVFQLRTYESSSVKFGQKKIEMFNEAGEIQIFRECGMKPVFFGETLIGDKMPNLTYMLGFENEEAQRAGWDKFGAHPDWRRISSLPEYKNTVSGVTNILLKPASYSEI